MNSLGRALTIRISRGGRRGRGLTPRTYIIFGDGETRDAGLLPEGLVGSGSWNGDPSRGSIGSSRSTATARTSARGVRSDRRPSTAVGEARARGVRREHDAAQGCGGLARTGRERAALLRGWRLGAGARVRGKRGGGLSRLDPAARRDRQAAGPGTDGLQRQGPPAGLRSAYPPGRATDRA